MKYMMSKHILEIHPEKRSMFSIFQQLNLAKAKKISKSHGKDDGLYKGISAANFFELKIMRTNT